MEEIRSKAYDDELADKGTSSDFIGGRKVRMVVCQKCGRRFDANSEPFRVNSRGYICERCFDKK